MFEYEPALVKRAICGNGRAGKEQIMRMVTELLSLPEMLANILAAMERTRRREG